VPRTQSRSADTKTQVDFDIHGLVGIRLIDPSPSDAAAVERQLGLQHSPLSRQPDIVLRFVKGLPASGLRYLGLEYGFTEDGFFVFCGGREKTKVRIPLEQIGAEQCEIICESGLRSVPLLTAILNLTVLKKDHVALHASAFVHKGTGIIATGWTKGGKTEALLAFASHGAEYVGDEWIWLSGKGDRVYGIPGNILLWRWQLNYLPHLQRQVGLGDRLLFKTISGLDWIQRMIPDGRFSRAFPARYLVEAMPLLRRRLFVKMTPRAIFGAGYGSLVAKPDRVFFMMSHQDPMISVEPMEPQEIANRMAFSVQHEQTALVEHYLAFKFAFPGLKNEFIEHAPELQRSILRRALAGKHGQAVRHPYPVSLPELYEAMVPFSE
jgi:hypothetical protein